MWRIHVTRTFKWVLRWVSLLCMQTCWYGFHGCILVLSHKCDYRRQVPKRELHELACHLQTIHLSQMHVFNFINSKLIWKFTFNSKWNQFSYQNFRKIFVAPRPCPMRYRSAELKGRKAFTSCVQLRPVPEALSSTFWFSLVFAAAFSVGSFCACGLFQNDDGHAPRRSVHHESLYLSGTRRPGVYRRFPVAIPRPRPDRMWFESLRAADADTRTNVRVSGLGVGGSSLDPHGTRP